MDLFYFTGQNDLWLGNFIGHWRFLPANVRMSDVKVNDCYIVSCKRPSQLENSKHVSAGPICKRLFTKSGDDDVIGHFGGYPRRNSHIMGNFLAWYYS